MTWKDRFPRENRYYETERGILYCGDALEILREFPDNSIDTIITDPPYGLSEHKEKVIREVLKEWLNGNEEYVPKKKGFMGAEWDAFIPPPALWREVYRVIKWGATALVFAGTRTQDLMSISMRLAGFELKDMILWLYSGFPKSQDISKMIDKRLGAEREIVGYSDSGLHHKCNVTNFKDWKRDNESLSPITKPATPEAKKWAGMKTHSLKPAYEPIIMAIKPNDGGYVDNALKWGVAGLNIDEARIGVERISVHDAPKGTFAGGKFGRGSIKNYREHIGRFPANVILDEESAKMLDKQSGRIGGGKFKKGSYRHKDPDNLYQLGIAKKEGRLQYAPDNYGDKGGASRFFYVAKASKKERGENNNHLTVKPIKLIEYLVKLTKMPNPEQIYIDPFIGSGTTAIVCEMHNRRWIGIELEKKYCDIAVARIKKFGNLKRVDDF